MKAETSGRIGLIRQSVDGDLQLPAKSKKACQRWCGDLYQRAMKRRHFLQSSTAALATVALPVWAAERPRRILIAGGWHCVNIGDIAHAPGLLRLLETHLPGVELALWPVPSTRSGYERELEPQVRAMLQSAFSNLTILKAGGAKKGPASRPELVEAMQWADLFIISSGGMHAEPLAVWQATTDKPSGVYAVTFGSTSASLRVMLDKTAFVYGRDSPSAKVLEEIGHSGPNSGLAPDGVFGFDLRDDASATAWLQEHGLTEGEFLCVIPRHRSSPYHRIYGYTPTAGDREVDRINAQFASADHAAARELIVHWVRSTGLKVLACPEMTYGVPLAKEQLVDPLPPDVKPNVVWKDTFWNADEAASVYARARALVSLDCHSPIIALAAGTPAIHLRVPTDNPHKSRMFADIGLGEWVHELDGMTGERLARMVMDIHENYPAAVAKVETAMTFVRQRQSETMQVVKGVLQAS
jgi:polysaccharide pyruvyl transferase WcaK-like protein